LIEGNYIGTDITGTVALGNGSDGVRIQGGANNNTIGGTVAGAGNVISGNNQAGVFITGSGTTRNIVQGNYIGTNAAGTAALRIYPDFNYAANGVVIDGGATLNLIGGDGSSAAADAAARNVISGNGWDGIQFRGSGTNNNTAAGNYVGVDASGVNAIPNKHAVSIAGGAAFNVVGTRGTEADTAGLRNILSGNVWQGIYLSDAGTTNNVIAGNYIGPNVNGNVAAGTTGQGIFMGYGAQSNRIGAEGSSAAADIAERNVISGNAWGGIWINGAGTNNNIVSGNYIGTNAAGTAALANGSDGVHIENGASNNTIGGSTAAARNLISGNSGLGVLITGGGTNNNLVAGNYIGTDVNGSGPVGYYNGPLGNAVNGVQVDSGAANNTIGGLTGTPGTGLGNVISGNHQRGVAMYGVSNNLVAGNIVGLNASGTAILSNYYQGIEIGGGTGNTVGGTAAGARNIMSGSGGGYGGILIANASGMLVSGNFIGTDVTGTRAPGNAYGGIFIVGASNNTIGGTTVAARNVISGNATNGIYITDAQNWYGLTAASTGNLVQGNFIGTNVSGSTALGNSGSGVLIVASSNTIGGTVAGAGNVISGNGQTGVIISAVGKTGTLFDGSGFVGATANLVAGNYIGTDITGTAALGNVSEGVRVSAGATNNTIGGSVAGARNIISGNEINSAPEGVFAAEVRVTGSGTNNNWIAGNYIGTNAAGSGALGTYSQGIAIDLGAAGNTVGGLTAVPGTGAGNVVSGNGRSGIALLLSSNNLIAGNIMGLNAAGTAILPNAQGIFFYGGTGNTLGGTVAGARNIISGNSALSSVVGSHANVGIFANASTLVQGNYIGTDITGTHAAPNSRGVGSRRSQVPTRRTTPLAARRRQLATSSAATRATAWTSPAPGRPATWSRATTSAQTLPVRQRWATALA
jgi:titin